MLESIEQRLVGDMTDYERSILRHGAVWFFLLLLGYYILRPIRDQIGAAYGIKNLSWLFAATFGVMLIAIPLYSALVGKFHRKKLVPSIYAFFVACLVVFWLGMKGPTLFPSLAEHLPESWQIWVARALFVWVSVYGLFIISFFWSVAGDMLSTAQGRRIFGIIAGGGTCGGMVGSQVAARLVGVVGVANLLLIPAVLLVVALLVYLSMEKSFGAFHTKNNKSVGGKPTGGNPFAGFTAVFKSRYLFSISLFGIFWATCSTPVYLQQSEIVKATYENATYDAMLIDNAGSLSVQQVNSEHARLQKAASDEASTKYFANVDLAVSCVTLLFQFVIVGWMMKKVGLGVTLAVLPLAYVIGLAALALSPTIAVMAVVAVLGRSAEYGICNPAREVLFAAIDREDRYKAKSFIDTIVRRGGDSAVASMYKGARESLGMATTTLAWGMVPIAVAWIGLSLFIGSENRKTIASNEQD